MNNLFNVYTVNDITIVKAQGSYVWDDKGVQYLDMYGGHAVISIGHRHPHWVKRIEKQLHEIAFYSNSVHIPIQKQLAGKLEELSGKEDYRLFLCNSGAEANENAMKLASFHNGKKKVVAFKNSFHGRTSLAVSVTDNPDLAAPINATDKVIFLPLNNEKVLENCFIQHCREISCVIIEGIQGVGGINVANMSFLRKMRELCDLYNVLLIADSVQCGYGRTGKFFSHDHAGIKADIYTMAKGMGNGFPVAGVLINPFIKARPGMLGSTFGGNHLACAAALAVLEVMADDDLMEKAKRSGEYLIECLEQVEDIENVRGRGLMVGFDVPKEYKDLRKNLLFKHNIFTGEAGQNTLRLLPALNITPKQINEFIDALKEEMAALKKLHEMQPQQTEEMITT